MCTLGKAFGWEYFGTDEGGAGGIFGVARGEERKRKEEMSLWRVYGEVGVVRKEGRGVKK